MSHTLKGMLSNLAVDKAAASVAHLEQLERDNQEGLKEAFVAFESDVHGLWPEMGTYMAGVQP